MPTTMLYCTKTHESPKRNQSRRNRPERESEEAVLLVDHQSRTAVEPDAGTDRTSVSSGFGEVHVAGELA